MIPRPAREDDAAAIGRVHVQAWRETYPGLVPDDHLAALDPVARAERWRRTIAAGPGVFVVEDEAGLFGFGNIGAGEHGDRLPFDGMIATLYVLARGQRRGAGHALMAAMARALRDDGRNGCALWVMRDNAPAVRFYERLGGVVVAQDSFTIGTATIAELAYGWRDLDALIARAEATR